MPPESPVPAAAPAPAASLLRSAFGTAPDGSAVACWTLDSGAGVRAEVLGYGATLRALHVPDPAGRADDVVLGLPALSDYAGRHPYLGAVVGRYANRIAHGRFTLDGRTHRIPVNDRGHALHGGPDGFHRRVWHAEPGPGNGPEAAALRLTLHSPDGDMGFPGALDVEVVYRLTGAGTLSIDYTARADHPTPVNLTNHAYFNLAGAGRGGILGHTLHLDAAAYLPVTAEAVPLGPAAPTAGTAFDFGAARRIGERIGDDDRQLADAGGYDHCWVLTARDPAGAPRRAARLADPASGRCMEVWTTEPGIQVYTGNALDGSLAGPAGRPYTRHGAICLETQHFPDSPNRPEYPATVLRPGAVYRSRTEFRFPHLEAPSTAAAVPDGSSGPSADGPSRDASSPLPSPRLG
ncbi:aldose 1-epimerase [Actinacidiphila yanglinensis]|uniref:Aldose 1-epimerase n=1 Tax=Actinacidiphila yanglinensis TaxID=310779 RepID=A0A1H6DWY5_9ACTN|nr:aldose epimerase family protein [Actinacidiphila yanglinensis]SEG89594.1 aldose 1-epimerase [Actinacidiphila yanglinensis]